MSCLELAPLHGHLLSVCELRQCDLLTLSGTMIYPCECTASVLMYCSVFVCESGICLPVDTHASTVITSVMLALFSSMPIAH